MNNHDMLALNELCFRYPGGDRDAVHNVSLQIPPATVTSILGPNGSGKTTLLSLLLGLQAPSSGTIAINGASEHTERRLLGLVPQDELFPLGFTVGEYVLLGRAPHLTLLQRPNSHDRAIAWNALERVGIADLSGRMIQFLSGGERQLAMVARALAQEPQVLLMDEPGSHLDLANKSRVMHLVRSLTEDGVTVLLTTHDPNAAATVSDGVVLMRQGEVVCQGTLCDALTSEALSETYGMAVQVVEIKGRLLVIEAD